MIGQNILHYRVIARVGAGGMGEVYRARDTRLERDVAIKVLHATSLGQEEARTRFRKEALTLARLNHPNIGTVFDFCTENGVDFLVMELVAGVSLRERIAGRPLAERDVIALGIAIASALEEAHEQRIIHRDLKPGNIMVTPRGQVKVLDFGLARLLRPESEADLTATMSESHVVAGTIPYMAPEQLRGHPADTRTDIWALGVVLYEMATGVRPFQGQSGFELSSAILDRSPTPLPPAVATTLRAVVERCLEKDPGRRYQRAGEVRAALETIQAGGTSLRVARPWLAISAGAATVAAMLGILFMADAGGLRGRFSSSASGAISHQIDSLAVLPLENLSRDAEQDYFAAGMHEALIVDLGKLSGLRRVSARASVLCYQTIDRPLREIARELGVGALITGTVQRVGNRVRITAHLIDPETGHKIWGDSY
jgi:TolB-like protein